MGEKKQPSLFDRPETIKQEIAKLPKEARQIIHRELYRLFADETLGVSSDLDYEYRVHYAIQRNTDLMNAMEKRFSPIDLGVAIIYFLVEIEKNKKVYVYEKKGVRTFVKANLFERKRGQPLLYLARMLKKASEQVDLSNESPIVAELLKENIGYGDGILENMYLGLLGVVGTRSNIQTLEFYRQKVEKGEFGHSSHVVVEDTAYLVSGKRLEMLKQDRLKKIDDVLKVLSSRK